MKLLLLVLAISVVWLPFGYRAHRDQPTPAQTTSLHRQDVVVQESALKPQPIRPFYMVDGLTTPAPDPNLSAIAPDAQIPGATLLRSLIARGVSQGFAGLLYDNRDRDHSPLARHLFPNLGHVVYGPSLRESGWDYGLAQRIVLPGPLIGNSSTALTAGAIRRSQTRFAMTQSRGPQVAFGHYVENSLYIYPEHKDHDAVDLYPANWPYAVNSQGSSGSDQPFIKALLMALAAFPADTRAALAENGLVAPTLQMILRRNLDGVVSDADYLGARAHPSAIDGADVKPGRMIAQASALRPDEIPAMVRLRMIADPFAETAGLANKSEHLFTTPSAIARIWRAHDWERDMVISTEDTTDPNGRAMTFHWRLLRGDPERVRIAPLDPQGRRVRVTMAWHDAYRAPQHRPGTGNAPLTSRVDIAVFADNGATLSAPAFLSVSFPTHQIRAYAPGPGGHLRLDSIDYDATARAARYDPILHWSAPWRDTFRYAPSGVLLGWQRRQGTDETPFLPDGRKADGTILRYELPASLNTIMTLKAVTVAD